MSIKDHVILAPMASLDLYWSHVMFMGPGKPCSPVTTLLNCPSLLRGGLLEGDWGSLGWQPGRTITRSQAFILGAETQFWLSRDFTDGCRMWDLWGHMYDVSVKFFPCRVYIDSNHCDTLIYECPLVCCCHLIVCLVVSMAWIRRCWIWLCLSWWLLYYFIYDIDCLFVFCLLMHVIVYRCKHNI
jgi:hypothetical protein